MLVRVKHETEQVEILPLPVRMHRLGNDDRAVFDMPPQDHLRFGDAMRPRDAFDHTIAGIEIRATRHRRIRLDRDIVRLAIRHHLALLPRGMQFDLVDGRIFARFLMQPLKMLRQEIAHAKRTHATLRAELVERLPRFAGTPIERGGPMQHIHVHIIELQQVKLTVERLACGIVPLFRIAQLRRHPQVLAILTLREARVLQRTSDASLVVVPRGTVDMTITGFQRALHHGGNALIVDTQHAQADLRNQIAVGKRDHRSVENSHGTTP